MVSLSRGPAIGVTATVPLPLLILFITTKVASPPPLLTVKFCSLSTLGFQRQPSQLLLLGDSPGRPRLQETSATGATGARARVTARVLWTPRSTLAICSAAQPAKCNQCISPRSSWCLPSLRLQRCSEPMHGLADGTVGTPFGSTAGNLWQRDRKEEAVRSNKI